MAAGKSVAVIGAGPAGALATDALVKERAFETIRVFERQDKIGGTCNVPPSIMASTQEPIPQVVSERMKAQHGIDAPFRHREVMREWVEGIFTRGNHLSLVELNTTLERAEKVDGRWVLTLRKSIAGEKNDYWWQERFDYLVVATGHFLFTIYAGYTRAVTKGPVISSLRKPNPTFGWAPFTHPRIDIRSEISSFEPATGRINFADGSSADDVDLVLFATGYEFSFPFLPNLKVINGRVPGLYEHVFNIDDPSLALIGMVYGAFGIRVFEWQAVAAARVFAGHATLPSKSEMEKWERDRMAKTGDNVSFLSLIPDFEEPYEALRVIAGDPAAGTEGRILPKYDQAWGDAFWELVKYRQDWWRAEAKKATKIRNIKWEISPLITSHLFLSLRQKDTYRLSSIISYISSHRFQRLIEAHNVEVIYKPVDILHVFSQSGGLPVKQPSPQRQAYRLLEMERWHKAVWADEGDIADHGTITKLANEAGLDGSRLLKRANEEKGLIEQEAGLTKDILDRKYLVHLSMY
ncbi:hypothetical protein CHU98_g2379 [Xylaria longipes]|nr:hypothetical protein CHU98_g2379 [Xylaria longipes]